MRKHSVLFVVVMVVVGLLASTSVASAKSKPWSKKHVKKVVGEAGHYEKLPHDEILWLQNSAVDIIYILPGKPAHESSGARHDMFQMQGGWHLGKKLTKKNKREHHRHGKHGWICCRKCTSYRYVRGYAIVKKAHGEAAAKQWVRSKWRATLGR